MSLRADWFASRCVPRGRSEPAGRGGIEVREEKAAGDQATGGFCERIRLDTAAAGGFGLVTISTSDMNRTR